MNKAKIFRTGRSQAVRLPKEYRFRTREVYVNKVDDLVVLFPRAKGWDILAEGIRRFTEDFMAERSQPAEPEKRKGL
jgi:antitoxin VapB